VTMLTLKRTAKGWRVQRVGARLFLVLSVVSCRPAAAVASRAGAGRGVNPDISNLRQRRPIGEADIGPVPIAAVAALRLQKELDGPPLAFRDGPVQHRLAEIDTPASSLTHDPPERRGGANRTGVSAKLSRSGRPQTACGAQTTESFVLSESFLRFLSTDGESRQQKGCRTSRK
jgi:hypothetical protein